MSKEELNELELIVSEFDTVDIKDINTLQDLKYEKISKVKLLQLISLAKQNNKQALTILIKYYYPFIVTKALNYYTNGVDLDDLIMVASMGFIEGIKSFKDGNIMQWTYFYIRKNIYKEISLEFTSVKLGDNFNYIVFLYLKYLEDLRNNRTESLTYEELAVKFGVDIKGMQRVVALVNREKIIPKDILFHDNKLGDTDNYDRDGIVAIIDKYLPSNFRTIFKMYYGFYGQRLLTEREIAKITNLCYTRVDAILKKSMEIINRTSAKNKFREYYDDDYIEPHYYLSKQSIRELKAPIKKLMYSKRSHGSIKK